MTELEKAAKEYAGEICGIYCEEKSDGYTEANDGFLAGARYQAERDAKLCEVKAKLCAYDEHSCGAYYLMVELEDCAQAIRASVEGEKP